MILSKDGQEFFDVEDEYDVKTGQNIALNKAQAKGYKQFFDVTKNGTDTFTIDAQEFGKAQAKGYDTVDVFKAKNAQPEMTKGQSLRRGIAQGGTLGFADEITGAAQSLLGDKTYDQARNESRDFDRAADAQNPMSYLGGNVAGGLATAIIPGAQAIGSIRKMGAIGAGFGAAGGLGSSESETIGGQALDTAQGAALGGVFGAAIPAGIQGIKAIPGIGGRAKQTIQTAMSGAKEASRKVDPLGFGLPVIDGIPKMTSGVKGALNAIKQRAANAAELKDLKGKNLADIADENILGMSALDGGDNRINDYLSTKAATVQPGFTSQDNYKAALKMGTEARSSARDFNNKEVAKDLTPLMSDLQREFQTARNQGYQSLQSRAAAESNMTGADYQSIKDFGNSLVRESEFSIIPKAQQMEVKKALEIIDNGSANIPGIESLDNTLDRLPFDSASPGQKFYRLQSARKLLQDSGNFFKDNKMSTPQRLLAQLEDRIDSVLKRSQSKVQADDLFSKGKRVEQNLFGLTEMRGKDKRINIDEGKVAKIFGDNDNAGRLRKSVEAAREYMQNPNFNPDTKNKLEAMFAQLDGFQKRAQDKRTLFALEKAGGPSSPAINRLAQQLSGEGVSEAAINNPAGFLNSADQFVKTYSEPIFGKSWSKLDPAQKQKMLKAQMWLEANPKSTLDQQSDVFGQIFGFTDKKN